VHIRLLFASCVILLFVSKWCTVTVTEPDGRRHSLDVLAESTYDAAHLFVVEAKKERAVGLPKPTLATIFEVVASGKVYRVRRRGTTTLDRRAAPEMERAERLYVLQAPRIGMTVTSGRSRIASLPQGRLRPRSSIYQDLH